MKMIIKTIDLSDKQLLDGAKEAAYELFNVIPKMPYTAAEITLGMMMISAYNSRITHFVTKKEFIKQCEYFWDSVEMPTMH